jgi:hypothetical protein
LNNNKRKRGWISIKYIGRQVYTEKNDNLYNFEKIEKYKNQGKSSLLYSLFPHSQGEGDKRLYFFTGE